jgi:hypothetical protein
MFLNTQGPTNVKHDLAVGGDILLKGKLYKEAQLVQVVEKDVFELGRNNYRPDVGEVHRVNDDEGYYWLAGDGNRVLASLERGQFQIFADSKRYDTTNDRYENMSAIPSIWERYGAVTFDNFFVMAQQLYPEHTTGLKQVLSTIKYTNHHATLVADLFTLEPDAFSFSLNTFLDLYYPFLPHGLAADVLDIVDIPALRLAAHLDTLDDVDRSCLIRRLYGLSSSSKADILAKLATVLRSSGVNLGLTDRIIRAIDEHALFLSAEIQVALDEHHAPTELRTFFRTLNEARLPTPLMLEVLHREIVKSMPDTADIVMGVVRRCVKSCVEVVHREILDVPTNVSLLLDAFDFDAPAILDASMPVNVDAFFSRKPVYMTVDRLLVAYKSMADRSIAHIPKMGVDEFAYRLMNKFNDKRTVATMLLAATYSYLTQTTKSAMDLIREKTSPAVSALMPPCSCDIFEYIRRHAAEPHVSAAICDVIFYVTNELEFTTLSGAGSAIACVKYAVFDGLSIPVPLVPFEDLLISDYIADVSNASSMPPSKQIGEFMDFVVKNELHSRLFCLF